MKVTTANVLCGIASFFIPGLGQLLQARILSALVQFLASAVLWIFWLGWLVTLYSIFDAVTHNPKE